MRREDGIFILGNAELEKHQKKHENIYCGFEGIIIDITSKHNEDAIMFWGNNLNETGIYTTKELGMFWVGWKQHTLYTFKKMVKGIMENRFSEKLEMGFPEIAITEELRKFLK